MFKSILPSRRLPSADFQMLTTPIDPTESEPNGKENYFAYATVNDAKPKTEKRKKAKTKGQQEQEPLSTEDFDRLLDDLQIPSTLRPKLATMDPTVKAAFLKSSHVLSQMRPVNNPPLTPRGLRKAHSSESLASMASPRPKKPSLEQYDLSPAPSRQYATGHSRGVSIDMRRHQPVDVKPIPIAPLKTNKAKKASVLSPDKYVSILLGQSSTVLDVEVVKKLRLLLRNEAASWTDVFVRAGGYDAILTRLNEILDIEWREEQHDDQILHELLRCVKALTTSAVGCNALRAACPSPWDKLVILLYSDKRPGEVATRQLIVELLLSLFELYPLGSLPSNGSPSTGLTTHSRSRSVPWELSTTSLTASSNLITLPRPHQTLFSLLKSLLLTRAPPPSESPGTPIEPHAFIEELHRPRIYKTYLQEMNDVCRDYFWVFCHPSNTIWDLSETDEAKVEKPRAPGGMTGGVEFEAMCYMTMHLKFVNAIASYAQALNLPKEHEHSAFQFHRDMFQSGIERILSIARKASTTYYPTLHLEIARYVAAAGRSGHEIPWGLSRLIGQPPAAMRKQVAAPPPAHPSRSNPTTPTKQRSAHPIYGAHASAYSARASQVALGASGEQRPVPPGSRKVTPMFN
ncbi:hypothetical protein FKP32DRAFT_1594809 [Trametes sanguinea]|nr:hypothetical protein FKP32DRAFT_1594809 [Trametes sanguinea]